MNIFKKILFLGKNFFFPGVCALCSISLIRADEIQFGLCEHCLSSIAAIQGIRCEICGKPLISEQKNCIPCRTITERSYDRLWVLFPYTGKYRKLLTAYKFNKNLSLAGFFAQKILEEIAGNSLLKESVIVPVPPRPGKIKHSGWDQVDYLIKQLEKKSERIPVKRCLKRSKSKIQKHLNRTDRLGNLKGRIYINGKTPKNAIIIDDVITTGSTLEVCAGVLKQAGAENVYALCLFYD
jgi:ComF family protein